MSLYNKYRPKSFDEVRGNKQTVETLRNLLQSASHPQVYLLHGPTGCGKTTIGRIIANTLHCSTMDYHELNTADFRGIDTVRDIRKQVSFRPVQGDVKVWLIDECHKLTNDAQNAILKLLEDVPRNTYFILTTTDSQKLLPTIKGRCSQFQVSPLSERDMKRLLHHITTSEGETLEREVYEQIIRDSLGYPRNALQILEQVLNTPSEHRLEVAHKTAEQQSESIKLCRALIKGESWKSVSTILKGLKGEDPESIRRHVLGYSQSVLLGGENDVAARVIEAFWEPLYNIGFPGLVYACYDVIQNR